MTEHELNQLKADVEQLKAFVFTTGLPDDAIVGAEYVSRLFNCSERAVVEGRFGTGKIPRCRQKPVGFRKGDVEKVLREKSKPLSRRAAEVRRKARTVKR